MLEDVARHLNRVDYKGMNRNCQTASNRRLGKMGRQFSQTQLNRLGHVTSFFVTVSSSDANVSTHTYTSLYFYFCDIVDYPQMTVTIPTNTLTLIFSSTGEDLTCVLAVCRTLSLPTTFLNALTSSQHVRRLCVIALLPDELRNKSTDLAAPLQGHRCSKTNINNSSEWKQV